MMRRLLRKRIDQVFRWVVRLAFLLAGILKLDQSSGFIYIVHAVQTGEWLSVPGLVAALGKAQSRRGYIMDITAVELDPVSLEKLRRALTAFIDLGAQNGQTRAA